jgi:diguanylate cyclase (GGDEF)-like protein/PAS domain S-box-containing protein
MIAGGMPVYLPSAVAAILALLGGALLVFRERFSQMAWLHLILSGGVIGWQCALAVLLASEGLGPAWKWSLATTALVTVLPAANFHFSDMATRWASPRYHLPACVWLVTVGFEAALLIFTDQFVPFLRSYSWGYYPAFGPIGQAFAGFTVLVLSLCAWVHVKAMKENPRGSVAWRRARLMVAGHLVGSAAVVDFAPVVGIDLFPCGGLFVVASLLLQVFTAWRYRFVRITPALAVHQVMDTMTDAVIVLDRDGMVRLLNRAASRMLQLPESELLHAHPAPAVAALLADASPGRSGPIEREYRVPGGGSLTVAVSLSQVLEAGGEAIATVATLHDVTEARLAQAQIHRLAYYDALTGLPNRLLLRERFRQAIAHAQRSRGQVAVLFLDLDRFKEVNDTLGHDAGDHLLKVVTERITECVRDSDAVMRATEPSEERTLARLGGDEFVLLLSPVAGGEGASKVASRIIRSLGEPVVLDGIGETATGVSIGIALYPGDGLDADTLMRNADLAMYDAKGAGRNTLRFFNESLNRETLDRFSMQTSLRRALLHEEFLLRYQPVTVSRTGSLIGIETRVFWNRASRDLLGERSFSDVAEETGVALSLTEWVIRTACFQMRAWQGAGVPPLRLMLTVGPGMLESGGLVDIVRQSLVQTRLNPGSVWLCVQSRRVRSGDQRATAVLQALSQLGVQLVADDFGAGRISVAELFAQPIGMVRLEGDYLARAVHSPEAAAAVRALLGLVHGLGRRAIACGVGTQESAQFLREAGCDYQAGDAHGPAMPAEEVPDFIRRAMQGSTDSGQPPGGTLGGGSIQAA